jgi:hypothetical protein
MAPAGQQGEDPERNETVHGDTPPSVNNHHAAASVAMGNVKFIFIL